MELLEVDEVRRPPLCDKWVYGACADAGVIASAQSQDPERSPATPPQ